jgi:putative restriction endonuclease
MNPSPDLYDALARRAAFDWVKDQVAHYGRDVLPRELLEAGFAFQGNQIRLVGPQGIFKPASMQLPISITTIPDGPYDDGYVADDLMAYRYRGTNPNHPDNVGLRELMRLRKPLIYFYRVLKGKYLAIWPVFIVGDDPITHTFKVQVDYQDLAMITEGDVGRDMDYQTTLRRAYITTSVRQRVHQRSFRERVLYAYREQCSMCRLRHAELLDAAHIIPDGDPDGEPTVQNGLSLCKLHHAAFDRNFIAVRPDYSIEVRRDILEENDGPMLLHGIKEMHDKLIVLPRGRGTKPGRDFLERRYSTFLNAQL